MAEPKYLLDSNICIYLLEGLSDKARQRVESHEPGELVTSAIAYAEVVRGLDPDDARARAKVDSLFKIVAVLPFGLNAAEAFAMVPFKRGKFDHLIAAHALALNLTVVTNNQTDFTDIPSLHVENWTL